MKNESYIKKCNVCVVYFTCYVFGSVLYILIVWYLDPYASFERILYVVCTIEERTRKVL